jgi:hypothetical protein
MNKRGFEKIPNVVTLSKVLSGEAKQIFTLISTLFNKEKGAAWPSFGFMETQTGWRQHKLEKAIGELEKAKMLLVIRKKGSVNRYQIQPISSWILDENHSKNVIKTTAPVTVPTTKTTAPVTVPTTAPVTVYTDLFYTNRLKNDTNRSDTLTASFSNGPKVLLTTISNKVLNVIPKEKIRFERLEENVVVKTEAPPKKEKSLDDIVDMPDGTKATRREWHDYLNNRKPIPFPEPEELSEEQKLDDQRAAEIAKLVKTATLNEEKRKAKLKSKTSTLEENVYE